MIREGKAGTEKTSTDGKVFEGGEQKFFRVEKYGSSLKVLKGDGSTLLEYDSASQAVSEVWFMTGWGTTGQWSAIIVPGLPVEACKEGIYASEGLV